MPQLHCIVCGGRLEQGIYFHSFPKEWRRSQDWQIAMFGKDHKPVAMKSSWKICSRHFEQKEYHNVGMSYLKSSAAPTLLPSFLVASTVSSSDPVIDKVIEIAQTPIENICLFCMTVLSQDEEVDIQANLTKEGQINVGEFVRNSLLNLHSGEQLLCNYICVKCLNLINEFEGYTIKSKTIQTNLENQYIKHRKSKKHENAIQIDAESEHNSEMKAEHDIIPNSNDVILNDKIPCTDISTDEIQTENIKGSLQDNVDTAIETNKKKPVRKRKSRSKKVKDNIIDKHLSSYCCEKCGKVYLTYAGFSMHMKVHGKAYHCEICNKTFTQKYNFKFHHLIHSGVRPHECETCGKKFRMPASLKFHIMAMHPIATTSSGFCCEKCGKTYLSYYGFKEHIRKHRYDNKLRCKICDKSLSCPSSLRKHNLIHEGIRSFECNECGKKFCDRHSFMSHMTSHSEVRNYQCHICEKAFKTTTNLAQHINMHLKPYQCLECGKSFSEKFILTKHMKDHPKEVINGPRDCEVCGKKCMNSHGLKLHMLVHGRNRTFQCEKCEKTFTFKHNLTMHMNIHTQDKPHSCSVCGKGFAQYINLKKHIDIHHSTEGLHLYDCKMCGKKCGNSHYFKVHMDVHSGKRNYKCNSCERAFVFKQNLTNHMKVHLQENLQV